MILVSAGVFAFCAYVVIPRMLYLPDGWLTSDGWKAVPLWKKATLSLVTLCLLFGMLFGAAALRESFSGSPTTSIDMIKRARFLSARLRGAYFRRCKGMYPSEAGDKLTEDLPSIVSMSEEQQFLRDHPDLREAERLFRSAIAQEERLDDGSPYNVANGYNQLGQHYLLGKEWENAIQSIGTALQLLRGLLEVPPQDRDILREISTAHFNLGEAYLSRFRGSRNPQDREQARENYQRSDSFDSQIGTKSETTQKRLRELG